MTELYIFLTRMLLTLFCDSCCFGVVVVVVLVLSPHLMLMPVDCRFLWRLPLQQRRPTLIRLRPRSGTNRKQVSDYLRDSTRDVTDLDIHNNEVISKTDTVTDYEIWMFPIAAIFLN